LARHSLVNQLSIAVRVTVRAFKYVLGKVLLYLSCIMNPQGVHENTARSFSIMCVMCYMLHTNHLCPVSFFLARRLNMNGRVPYLVNVWIQDYKKRPMEIIVDRNQYNLLFKYIHPSSPPSDEFVRCLACLLVMLYARVIDGLHQTFRSSLLFCRPLEVWSKIDS
jgi:hypothetical protein